VASDRMKSTILIADRNPYVRKFLQRELTNAGHKVALAENARQILLMIERDPSLRLVIVDPDLPDRDMTPVFENLRLHHPCLPVLVHSLPEEYTEKCAGLRTWFVEKRGSSVEAIITMVDRILG
jgi:DNA-binding NtrC family response regulator